ncbi:MAG: glycine cleavage system protein GcvH [Candidatus Thorarchaeota archaeon]|nr:glycine cleavage system protein GcvH [Candidatus Thorarchaeota archaeon]
MKDKTRVMDGLYYTKDHEWARVEDGLVTVGITDYAQNSLHEITFVEVNDVGTTVNAGKVCGLVESMKASSDVISPVSGEIVEVNERLEEAPELVNKDPYGTGWMLKIRPASLKEDLAKLMDSKAYAKFLETL